MSVLFYGFIIQRFGDKICGLAGREILNKKTAKKIEIRPDRNTGIKLGMGINQKTLRATRVLNEHWNSLEFDYMDLIYFLNMDRIGNDIVKKILDQQDLKEEVADTEENISLDAQEVIEYKFTASLESKIRTIEKKYTKGFNIGTHHYWSFQIALWMRDILKLDRDKAEEELLNWTKRNEKNVRDLTSAMNDTKNTIVSVYEKDIDHKYSLVKGLKDRSLYFHKHEVELVRSMLKEAKKDRRVNSNAPSMLYFTFVCMSKYFGSNPFYCSKKDLMKYSGLNSNKTYIRWLKWLNDKGYIEQVKRGSNYTGKASKYFVPCVVTDGVDGNGIVINITDGLNVKDLYKQIISAARE